MKHKSEKAAHQKESFYSDKTLKIKRKRKNEKKTIEQKWNTKVDKTAHHNPAH